MFWHQAVVVRPSNINTVRQMSDQQAEEVHSSTRMQGVMTWRPRSCAKPGTDHHHSCGARLQLQQHATVSATVVLAAPFQLIDSLFTENKELYSGDVMVLSVSKRCSNLLICCHVWFQVLTWWVPERVSTITWPPNLIPGAGEFRAPHLPENHKRFTREGSVVLTKVWLVWEDSGSKSPYLIGLARYVSLAFKFERMAGKG